MSESWKQEFVTYLEESTSATLLVSQALAAKEQNLPARIYKYRCDNSYTRTNLETDCRVPHTFASLANVWARAARRLQLNVDVVRKAHSSQSAR